MYNKILVLGAAGQIGRILTKDLLEQTDSDLVLFGRNITDRLSIQNDRVELVNGDFSDEKTLEKAIQDVDLVFVSAMNRAQDIQVIAKVLESKPGIKMLGASMAGLHDDVPKALEEFAQQNLPSSYIEGEKESAQIIEDSNIDYTLLHLTWLYDDPSNTSYELVPTPEILKDAQVTREAVGQAVIDIITDEDQNKYKRKGFGVGEPNTHYDKPSFY
ncbi:NAD(P)H-binding protein [Staphylococcus carnosus]|uniref:NAD(P)H-binding protein n=1 Tax=Staphylococcus carnosus TaxID=1281 RepID=UPI00081A2C9B|nr:NAD(P)H-binding protein [Staphylococcus carnosus]ANZ33642.1 oxidoreductase [Staphylococcus carnosus]UTB81050.1 oxidoreductase [Staphylococcus carnosus]UTB85812.1 oxidoreductase [Staphylococcus carnosus]